MIAVLTETGLWWLTTAGIFWTLVVGMIIVATNKHNGK
jgi:hypothetical protein